MKANCTPAIIVLLLSAALYAGTASAQAFPSKVVRLVVPFPAGGSNDMVARALSMGVFVPAATPKEAIERLNAEVMRIVQLPEVKNGMLRDGFVVSPQGPAEYGAFTKVKMEQIERIARAAKIKLD